jgi:predicted transposase/invertase (TIGR01784 family)
VSFDNACKLLAETYPTEFARWLLATEPSKVEILKTELSLEPIRADSVTFLRTANRILHIEFQTTVKSDTPIPFRMLDYSVRLIRQYGIPVTQVVIFLQETSDEIAFTEEYVNETTTHRYRALRMWEQDSAMFLNSPGLLALAPLTRTTSPQRLLAQVAERVARISDRGERQNMAGCTEILAGLRFDKDLIRQFLREDIMQESVIYQDILKKGEEKGEQKGEQKGVLLLCLSLLDERFGEIDSSIISRVKVLNKNQLEALGRKLLSISSIDDLVTWLDENASN